MARSSTNPVPIKVYDGTKEQVRLMAAVSNVPQAEILQRAVNEFLERHADEFAAGLKRAGQALLGGRAEAVAYLLDEDVAAVRRVSGNDGT